MIKTIDALSPITAQNALSKSKNVESGSDFFSILSDSLNELNDKQIKAQSALSDVATGRVKDLHTTAITIGKAEMSMKVMLEVRNKALNAYKEILKTPI